MRKTIESALSDNLGHTNEAQLIDISARVEFDLYQSAKNPITYNNAAVRKV